MNCIPETSNPKGLPMEVSGHGGAAQEGRDRGHPRGRVPAQKALPGGPFILQRQG